MSENTITTLTISLDETGVRVEGPLHDTLMCYALLEMARDAVKDAKPQPRIQAPDPGDMLALQRRVRS